MSAPFQSLSRVVDAPHHHLPMELFFRICRHAVGSDSWQAANFSAVCRAWYRGCQIAGWRGVSVNGIAAPPDWSFLRSPTRWWVGGLRTSYDESFDPEWLDKEMWKSMTQLRNLSIIIPRPPLLLAVKRAGTAKMLRTLDVTLTQASLRFVSAFMKSCKNLHRCKITYVGRFLGSSQIIRPLDSLAQTLCSLSTLHTLKIDSFYVPWEFLMAPAGGALTEITIIAHPDAISVNLQSWLLQVPALTHLKLRDVPVTHERDNWFNLPWPANLVLLSFSSRTVRVSRESLQISGEVLCPDSRRRQVRFSPHTTYAGGCFLGALLHQCPSLMIIYVSFSPIFLRRVVMNLQCVRVDSSRASDDMPIV